MRKIFDLFSLIVGIANIVVFGVLLSFIYIGGISLSKGISSTDLMITILTALAVLLTGISIFVALAGFFSYNTMTTRAVEAAEQKAIDLINGLKKRKEELDKREETLKIIDNFSSTISDSVLEKLKTKKRKSKSDGE